MSTELLQTSNGKLAIHFGMENGNPQLFCIHGGMGLDSNSLIPYLAGLSSLFDLVFIDLPGHGKSEPSSNGQYHLQDLSRAVCEVVQKLKKNSISGVFGHSLGGMVAIQSLADEQALFDFAILSNTAMNDVWLKQADEAVKLLDQKRLTAALRSYGENPGIETLRELAVLYGPGYFPELKTESAEKQMADFSYNDEANSFLSEKVYPGMDLYREVQKIYTSTLIISGDLDPIVPTICQATLALSLKDAELATISNTGHFPFVTEKKAFNKFVSNWWDNVRRKKV